MPSARACCHPRCPSLKPEARRVESMMHATLELPWLGVVPRASGKCEW